jgi:hypothetical protein
MNAVSTSTRSTEMLPTLSIPLCNFIFSVTKGNGTGSHCDNNDLGVPKVWPRDPISLNYLDFCM